MLAANLYVDRLDLAKYLTPEEWRGAGVASAQELATSLQSGALPLEALPHLTSRKRYALSLALRAQEIMPPVQSLELPRPLPVNLYELNEPGTDTPVFVTGNSEFTLTVLTGVLATTVSPFFLLLVDCRGDTVDMAMVYRSFTPQRLAQALDTQGLAARVSHRTLIIPGILGPLKEELAAYTGWDMRVGPICAAELPLFLGDLWRPPEGWEG